MQNLLVEFRGVTHEISPDMRIIIEAESVLGLPVLADLIDGVYSFTAMMGLITAGLRTLGNKTALRDRAQAEATGVDPLPPLPPFADYANLTLDEVCAEIHMSKAGTLLEALAAAMRPDIAPSGESQGNAPAGEPGPGSASSDTPTASSAKSRKSS